MDRTRMCYEPGATPHGLPFDPFKSCVVPRPIGWIATRSAAGVDNLTPFSQFTNVSFDPAMVMFSANQTPDGARKDTVVNAAALTADGRVDVLRIRPIARMGYFDYTSVESAFQMVIPGDERLLVGLEGSAAKGRTI